MNWATSTVGQLYGYYLNLKGEGEDQGRYRPAVEFMTVFGSIKSTIMPGIDFRVDSSRESTLVEVANNI